MRAVVLGFLLLHVELLDLSSHPVHFHGSLLRVGAVVLGNLEAVDTRVGDGLDSAFCTVQAFFTIWSFSASSTFTWVLVMARAMASLNSFLVGGEGVGDD